MTDLRPKRLDLAALASDACAVVPTRDRPEALGRCLAALRASADGIGERLALVVADDGSSDAAAVGAVAARHGAELLRLGGSGPAAARNAGARASSRQVVMFCDDDCEPAPRWAERMLRSLDAGREVVAGRTVSPQGARAPLRAGQAITNSLLLGTLRSLGARVGFAPSCNLALRRRVLERVEFDESFPSAAGEDRDWCERLAAAGIAIGYEPRALIVHSPAVTLRGFLRQQWGYGRGGARYRRAGHGRHPAPPGFWRELMGAGRREGPAVSALLLAAQLATAGGALAEAIEARNRG
ncbi:glycosyltransferase [Thermoleophilia bacterium SCSIO 60948]|nr:glycosyltransferase [Thermoleophilia bacterium SCSIO 60948]